MKSRDDQLESHYYPIVLKHLANQGYITSSYDHKGREVLFISRGQGQLIVDVYGLRGGNDLRTRRIEAVAVEVKRKRTSTPLRYIAQAESYSRLAHRCYLAQPFDFTQKTKVEAARAGVGLLRIRGHKVEIVAESKLFEPDPAALSLFLNHSLRISQCAICGCFRFRYSSASTTNKSGGGHWRRDDVTRSRRQHNKLTFLCEECEEHWAAAGEVGKLQRRLERLEKRLKRLTASHKRLKAKV